MTLTTEALMILFLLTILKNSVSLSLGRSMRLGKYRLRPIIVFRQPQPDYVEDEDPFSFYREPTVQESSYPEYDEYISGGKPDYDSFAQLYGKSDNFVQGLEENAAAFLRPISTIPPTTTLSTFETSEMPKPTSTVYRFNRGQKEFPMLRPPTESRRSVPDANLETYGVIKNFESARVKPAEKSFTDILSAELEHLKPRAH